MNHYWILLGATTGLLLLFFGMIVLILGLVTPFLVRWNALGVRLLAGDLADAVPGVGSHPWVEAALSGVVVTLVGAGMVYAGLELVPTI